MNYYPFDSRKKIYRNKTGAMVCGESFTPRLLLHNDARVSAAFLRIEKDAEDLMEYEMKRTGAVEEYGVYEVSLPLDTGLYWYDFRYESDFGEFFVVKENASRGVVSDKPGYRWQQTVYDLPESTPDYLRGGIMYQIFPDRFYASGAKKANIPEDRVLRDDWGGVPFYEQNDPKNRLGNDYFGGDFRGITQKLPYIKSLGVSCIYLNPVFEAHSNHRYNTADYFKCDPLLGSNKDFSDLCRAAESFGISIILDGVFSHTGDDSIYFNKYRRYGSGGAYNDENSPYRKWYKFGETRDEYECWWGVKSLPEVKEDDESYLDFICGEKGVLRYWMELGASGWRLDVADELPDVFLERLRKAVKEADKNAFVLGEVWENATNKISYGKRRKYLLGSQLDSVMNYPFARGIIDYIRRGDANGLLNTVTEICELYPPFALNLLMNHIGTHDTARILNVLSRDSDPSGDRSTQAARLTEDELKFAKRRLKAAAVIQYTLPGIPCLYYGDEAGLSGGADPFCRGCYPWGNEDTELIEFYRALGAARRMICALKSGDFEEFCVKDGLFSFIRTDGESAALISVNAGNHEEHIELPPGFKVVFGKVESAGGINIGEYEYFIAEKKR